MTNYWETRNPPPPKTQSRQHRGWFLFLTFSTVYWIQSLFRIKNTISNFSTYSSLDITYWCYFSSFQIFKYSWQLCAYIIELLTNVKSTKRTFNSQHSKEISKNINAAMEHSWDIQYTDYEMLGRTKSRQSGVAKFCLKRERTAMAALTMEVRLLYGSHQMKTI